MKKGPGGPSGIDARAAQAAPIAQFATARAALM
jgi:hypothetical protein